MAVCNHLCIHTYIYISQDSLGFPRIRYGLLGFARISQGLTRPNKVAQGLTRSHMVSQGLTRSHKVPQGPKRSHKASQGLTRSHKVSQGLTWSHKVSQERIYFRSVWLGSDWFGFAIHDDDDDEGLPTKQNTTLGMKFYVLLCGANYLDELLSGCVCGSFH